MQHTREVRTGLLFFAVQGDENAFFEVVKFWICKDQLRDIFDEFVASF